MILFLALLVGHLLADYPLQGDFMAKAKNRTAPFPGVPWQTVLLSHAAIHAGVVWMLTGSAVCGAIELLLHAWIDDAKCRGRISFNADQLLHLLCKAGYVTALFLTGDPT